MLYIDRIYKIVLLAVFCISCEEFVSIDPPRTDLVRETVFTNENTANAALTDIYADMVTAGFASGNGFNSFTLLSAFSSDEWVNVVNPQSSNQEFSDNELQPLNPLIANLWSDLYRYIYKANAVIEGLEDNTSLSENLKRQLVGEAKFIRAFSHFYLTNLWGDVPLVLSTNYHANLNITKSSITSVYSQIKEDLLSAFELLPENYNHAGSERVRPNRWVALALLARVYLFCGDWSEAEEAASGVISNPLYSLNLDLTEVFLLNNREALWQLHSTTGPKELSAFLIVSSPSHGEMRNGLIEAFDQSDLRYLNWVGKTATQPVHYFPTKYKTNAPVTEFTTVIRLSELHLVRAEARAELNKLDGENSAVEDLNVIRARAGLQPVAINTKDELVTLVLKERQLEFFCEWGHRWLDLKRRGIISVVMKEIKPATWHDTDALYPIPEEQILKAPLMANSQNPGY